MIEQPSDRSLLGPENFTSGLQDQSWISLVRIVFSGTAITLAGFSLLQFMAGNHLFASIELIATLVLLWYAWRLPKTGNPLLLVNIYTMLDFHG